jgi:hypothetical protein
MRLHRRSRPVITGLVLVLLFSSLSFKCDGNGPPDPVRNAAKAADDIAGAIHEMIILKRKLGEKKTISPVEEKTLTELLLKLNTADKVFVTQLKALRALPDAPTKASLATLFAQVTSALDELNNKGLLPLQSADARSQLTRFLALANAAAKIIEAFLQS